MLFTREINEHAINDKKKWKVPMEATQRKNDKIINAW